MTDSNRPLYHFTAPSNWLNDPNGLIQWQGRYHLYYQYNPAEAKWGPISWGHADSSDLIHWRHLPVVLSPEAGGPDANGVWSGCAVAQEERVAFLYTGVSDGPDGLYTQRACLAWSEGDLTHLERHPGNPVIPNLPEGGLSGCRDHTVWQEPDGYRMGIGSGHSGGAGLVWLYRSSDLVNWDLLGPLCSAADVPPTDIRLGDMWECPAFIAVDGQHALLISACGEDAYGPTIFTGTYQKNRFQPRIAEKLDYGRNAFYAPQTFYDDAGRCLMFGWLTEARTVESHLEAGWAGAMSLPRQIHIGADGLPRYTFTEEAHSLRAPGAHVQLPAQILQNGAHLAPESGAQFEFQLTLTKGTAARCGLILRRSPDGTEETRLAIDWQAGTLTLERGRSSLDERAFRNDLIADLDLSSGTLRLHLYLDASVIECIADERVCLTGRIYPTRSDAVGLGLFSEGGNTKLDSLDLYPLASAW